VSRLGSCVSDRSIYCLCSFLCWWVEVPCRYYLIIPLLIWFADTTEATISDYKLGYCESNIFSTREACCAGKSSIPGTNGVVGVNCEQWVWWSNSFWIKYCIYVALAGKSFFGAPLFNLRKPAASRNLPTLNPVPLFWEIILSGTSI
jgi:hypothetical protein